MKVLNCPSPALSIKMEEIRLEEKRVQNDQTERKETIREKFIRFFDVMTIEPMMFLQGLGWCMTSISQTQMLLYKTCRGKIDQADDLYIKAKQISKPACINVNNILSF